ncbi:MAG TPA: hypothetical protein PLI95_28945, partial [Polyangiaceae bacterium]|nr:hypothetical protein [Polyangiaceae bacterium]
MLMRFPRFSFVRANVGPAPIQFGTREDASTTTLGREEGVIFVQENWVSVHGTARGACRKDDRHGQ